MNMKTFTEFNTELDEAAQGHTIEAHGIRGMKGTAWRKTFKSHEHLSDWADKNDSIEVHAVRDLDHVKTGKKSSTMKEEVLDELSMDTLTSYKKKAGESATAADKAGDINKGNKRFKGIMKATFKQFAKEELEEQATWYSKEKFMADAEKKHGKITHTSRDKDGRTHYHIAGGQTSGMSDTDGKGSTSYNVHAKPHTAK